MAQLEELHYEIDNKIKAMELNPTDLSAAGGTGQRREKRHSNNAEGRSGILLEESERFLTNEGS